MAYAGPENRLVGWKAIGQFLRCTERTARRWESNRALPVYRMPGEGRRLVWAHTDELMAWLRALPSEARAELAPELASPLSATTASRRTSWGWPTAVAVLLIASGLAIWKTPLLSGRQPANADRKAYDGNREAATLYTTARFELSTRTAQGLAAAERDFRRLVQLDPRQAAGWTGLANTYLMLREFGGLSDEAAYPQAAEAAQKAIALDPNSADAWLDQAFISFWWRGQSAAALRAFDRALELAPNWAKAFHWYGTALLERGEFDKSLRMMARARALDPDNRAIVADEGWIRFIAGQRAEGLATLERMVALDPSFVAWHTYLARAYLLLGRDEEFLREARTAAELRGRTETLGRLDAAQQQFQLGGRSALLDALSASEAQAVARGAGSAVVVAQYRALADDEGGMYRWIGVAEKQHDHLLSSLRVDPEFSPYRSQPPYQALLQRLP